MVVMEAVKQCMNHGEDPNLWFYRNSSGTIEVDLLVENADGLHPIEIKSASTYSDRMGTKLKAFGEVVKNSSLPVVVYAGKTFDNQAVNYADVLNWWKRG